MQFAFQNQAIFSSLFAKNHFYSIQSQLFAKQEYLQENKTEEAFHEWGLNHESDSYFSSSECYNSPALTSDSRTASTCSEKSEERVSNLASASKKISKKTSNENKPLSKSKKRVRRDLWKPNEDHMLLALIEVYGFKWTLIGKEIGDRSGKQVRDRYMNYLRPGITGNNHWTDEEDEQFISLYYQFGNKWSQIAKYLPGRSECQVKNRFHAYIKDQLNLKDSKRCAQGNINDIFEDKSVKTEQMPDKSCKKETYRSESPSNSDCSIEPKSESFEIFLNKFFEGEKIEHNIHRSEEETFYFPNTVKDFSGFDQDLPHEVFSFGEGYNLQFLM